MKVKRLIQSLERTGLVNPIASGPKDTRKETQEIIRRINAAERFEIADTEVSDDLLASAKALAEAGLYRLPFPLCYLELPSFSGDTQLQILDLRGQEEGGPSNKDKVLGRYVFNGHRMALLEQRGDQIVVSGIFSLDNSREMNCYTYHPISYVLDPIAFQGFVVPDDVPPDTDLEKIREDHERYAIVKKTVDEGWTYPDGCYFPGHVGNNYLLSSDFIASILPPMINVWLVMMNTSWVKKQRFSYAGKQPFSRGRPINAHTKVLIEAHDEDRASLSGGDGSLRRMVRLHLRRGHSRCQPYGPRDNPQYKIIWIEPVLVGYAEEGVVTHDYFIKA